MQLRGGGGKGQPSFSRDAWKVRMVAGLVSLSLQKKRRVFCSAKVTATYDEWQVTRVFADSAQILIITWKQWELELLSKWATFVHRGALA